MPGAEILLLSLILCLGIFVQAAAGFAAGLLMVPLLLWAGWGIPEAQAYLLIATIPQNVWGLWQFRDTLRPREVVFPATLRLLALPVGILVLHWLEALPESQIRQIVGGIILVVTATIIVLQPAPQAKLHSGWMWVSFLSSGFLQGLIGVGGPSMVLWVQAHDWSTRRSRAFLFAMYLISLLPALLLLWLVFEERIVQPAITATGLIPLLLVITWLGLRFGSSLGRRRLRRVTLALLLLIGLSSLIAPWLRFAPPAAEASGGGPATVTPADRPPHAPLEEASSSGA